MEEKKSAWKLVDASSLPVAAGVEEARRQWEKQQVWCLTPWGQWRRGVVLSVRNDGVVLVGIYQNRRVHFVAGISIEDVSIALRMASH